MGSWRRVCLRVSLCSAAALLAVAPARAADIYVAAGANLQTAIDAAQPGDRLLLAPGATFTGNFRLPNKGAATTYITIRSAAADTLLPLAGVRITPADAPNLPVLRSPNTASALTTAAGAHHWRLQYLEFRANVAASGTSSRSAPAPQTLLTQVPHHLVLDHLYIHGDPALGQKRGIALHSGATWVTDSYIADMKGVGMDTQAINGYNGPGPYTIVNNYLEAAGENFMLGGASPKIPDLIPADIEFTGNHLYKPLAWRTPIVPTPAGVTAVAGGSGALPAGTYSYRVVAARRTAQDAWAYSARSPEVTVAVGAGGRVTVVVGAGRGRDHVSRLPGAGARGAGPLLRHRGDELRRRRHGRGRGRHGHVGHGHALGGEEPLRAEGGGTRPRARQPDGALLEGIADRLCRAPHAAQPGRHVAVGVRARRDVHRQSGAACRLRRADRRLRHQCDQRADPPHHDRPQHLRRHQLGPRGAAAGAGSRSATGRATSRSTTTPSCTMGTAIYVYGGSYGAEMTVANLRFTNNLLKHNTYGIMGNGRAYGTDTLTAYFPGAVLQRNTLAGGVGLAVSGRHGVPDRRVLAGAVCRCRGLQFRA